MKILRIFVAVFACLIPALNAQNSLTRLGEFMVNSYTDDFQGVCEIASLPGDGFVAVWQGYTAGQTSVQNVIARIYDASGSPKTPEMLINTPNGFSIGGPAVASAPNGNFVIVWGQFSGASSPIDVYARVFDQSGNDIRAAFPVAEGAGDQYNPEVAMADDGRFVVVWDDGPTGGARDIYAQRYSASGISRGGRISVNTTTTGDQAEATVVFGNNHDFLVTWDSTLDPNASEATRDVEIHGRLFGDDGVAKSVGGSTNEFAVTVLPGIQQSSALAFHPDMGFLVAWSDRKADALGDSDPDAVVAQRLDAAANKIGSPFLLNDSTTGNQNSPTVRFLPNGDFVAGWASSSIDGNGFGVALRRFTGSTAPANPTPIDANDLPVNTYTALDQYPRPNGGLAIDSRGNITVIWQSNRQEGNHSTQVSWGVYADKFYLPNQGPPLSEFRVNTATTGDQTQPAVAMNSSGQAVVAWTSTAGGDPGDIFFQRYDAAGRRVGTQTQANATVSGTQSFPAVGIDGSGNVVVAWQSDQTGGLNVYARKFPVVGNPGTETLIAGGSADEDTASLSVNDEGRCVISWTEHNGPGGFIRAQLFSATGNFVTDGPLRTPWEAPNGYGGNHSSVSLAANSAAFDIAWGAGEGTFATSGVYLRRYGADGSEGAQLHVNDQSFPNGYQESHPSVVRTAAGGAAVLFVRVGVVRGGIPYNDLILVPNAELSPGGVERLISSDVNAEVTSSVASLPSGKFLVNWTDRAIDGDGPGIAIARANSGGLLANTKAQVNLFAAGAQYSVQGRNAAADGLGNYMLVWQSIGQDGSGNGIFATKFFSAEPAVVSTSAATDLTANSATLRGTVTPNDSAVNVSFELAESEAALGTANASNLAATPASFPAGLSSPQPVSRLVTQLTLGLGDSPKTYFYRTKAFPESGGSPIYGEVASFTVQNTAPVANDDAFVILGNEQLAVLPNDFDVDGDPLRIVNVSLPDAGSGEPTVSVDAKKISYNPNDLFPDQLAGDRFTYTVSDRAAGGLSATATVRVFSVKVLRGVYAGLIGEPGGGADTAGRLDIMLSPTGQVTGSFKWLGRLYSFKGGAPLGSDGRLTITKPKIGPDGKLVPGKVLELALILDPITRVLTGTLSDTETNTVVQAELTGTVTTDEVSTLPEPGTFNAYIDTGSSSGLLEAVASEGAAPAVLPKGVGFTQVTVKKSGKTRPARFVGRMPDAQPFSSGAKAFVKALRAAAGARYVLAVDNLYPKTRDMNNRLQNGGFVSGNVGFTKVSDRFDSALNWERRPNVGTRFPAGFRTGLAAFTATLNAIRYNRPAPGVLPAGIVNDTRTINAKIEFTEGSLANTIVHTLKLTRAGNGPVRTRVEPLNPVANAEQVKISINAITGKFTGNFIHPANAGLRKPPRTTISGLFQGQDGQGTFDAPDATSTTGRITILAQ